MEIKKSAVVGTLESSDIMITLNPSDAGRLGIQSAQVVAVDKGALDCTIQARTITVAHRAADLSEYNWKEIDSWNA